MFKLKKATPQSDVYLYCDLCVQKVTEVVEYEHPSFPETQQYFCCDCIDKMRECWNNGAVDE